MTRFEYQIQSYPLNRKASLAQMQDDLNLRGEQGWELVSVIPATFAHTGHTALFKRVLATPDDGGSGL